MASGVDESQSTRVRDLTVGALKSTSLFCNASWRLLSDFVDAVGGPTLVDRAQTFGDLQMLVVVAGRVWVKSGPAAAILRGTGVHLVGDGAEPVEILPERATGIAAVFLIRSVHWNKIRSFRLARSLILDGLTDDDAHPRERALKRALEAVKQANRTEYLWFAHPDLSGDGPLAVQPLFQLVTDGVSRAVPDEVNLLLEILEKAPHPIEIWRNGERNTGSVGDDGLNDIFNGTYEPSPGEHTDRVLFYQSDRLVPSLSSLADPSRPSFHPPRGPLRGIYLHDEEGPAFPVELIAFLAGLEGLTPRTLPHGTPPPRAPTPVHPASSPGDPDLFFYGTLQSISLRSSREAPTATEPDPSRPGTGGVRMEFRESLGRLLSPAIQLLERRRHFRVEPLAEKRIERDFIRAPLDVKAILRKLQLHGSGGAPFSASVVERDRAIHQSLGLIASGLTFKLVGIAVSGGGASALRVGALLEAIEQGPYSVPVHFFGGVSGGALVGAYYCAQGTGGVSRLVDACESLEWMLPLLAVASWPIEAWVDKDLFGRRVEDLAYPAFLPLTTELAGGDPPKAVCVTAGTLGEAVRASGSLPVAFGPTKKNGKRYADGAAGALLPCEIVRHKVDVLLACDAVPGPAHSNPWFDKPLGEVAHDRTPVGRIIDGWAWVSFMLHNATEEYAKQADIVLTFQPQRLPMLETMAWERASEIVATARLDPNVPIKAYELYLAWHYTGTGVLGGVISTVSPPWIGP